MRVQAVEGILVDPGSACVGKVRVGKEGVRDRGGQGQLQLAHERCHALLAALGHSALQRLRTLATALDACSTALETQRASPPRRAQHVPSSLDYPAPSIVRGTQFSADHYQPPPWR
jgi:hypothetical protein